MNPVAATPGAGCSNHPLRTGFLKWQCHVRQIAMRKNQGRPDAAITPALTLPDEAEPLGHIITVINKAPGYSVTPEMRHMAARTDDPAQVRDAALRYLSSSYYQKHKEFSDILTATFPRGSKTAARLDRAGACTLTFEAYAQRFDLRCKVWRLAPHNPLHQATIAHNVLFNPTMPPGTGVLGFEPDWAASTSDPGYG